MQCATTRHNMLPDYKAMRHDMRQTTRQPSVVIPLSPCSLCLCYCCCFSMTFITSTCKGNSGDCPCPRHVSKLKWAPNDLDECRDCGHWQSLHPEPEPECSDTLHSTLSVAAFISKARANMKNAQDKTNVGFRSGGRNVGKGKGRANIAEKSKSSSSRTSKVWFITFWLIDLILNDLYLKLLIISTMKRWKVASHWTKARLLSKKLKLLVHWLLTARSVSKGVCLPGQAYCYTGRRPVPRHSMVLTWEKCSQSLQSVEQIQMNQSIQTKWRAQQRLMEIKILSQDRPLFLVHLFYFYNSI